MIHISTLSLSLVVTSLDIGSWLETHKAWHPNCCSQVEGTDLNQSVHAMVLEINGKGFTSIIYSEQNRMKILCYYFVTPLFWHPLSQRRPHTVSTEWSIPSLRQFAILTNPSLGLAQRGLYSIRNTDWLSLLLHVYTLKSSRLTLLSAQAAHSSISSITHKISIIIKHVDYWITLLWRCSNHSGNRQPRALARCF